MPATKRARRVRDNSEFDAQRLLSRLKAPSTGAPGYAWDLSLIVAARQAQQAGRFREAVRMSEAMQTDDAIFVARSNRLAPLDVIDVEIEPSSAKGKSIANEASALFGNDGIAISRKTVADIHGTLVDHGIAVAINRWTTRADASRKDVVVEPWPLEHVYWSEAHKSLMTATENGIVPITNGDGTWVVFRTKHLTPWRGNAAILPASIVWAGHAFAARDWSKGSTSHGNAKPVGTLPEGVSLQVSDGNGGMRTSDEAEMLLELLLALSSEDSPVGVMAAGMKLDFLTNSSKAWEVWERLMLNRERAAARIYLGTDGTLGATGGAPGVDITQLFGVATTRLQGDIQTITDGFQTGTIEPWTAINFGDSSLAPYRAYLLPDPDDQKTREDYAARQTKLQELIKAARENGFAVTQEYVNELASKLNVEPPMLASQTTTTSAFFAYELDGGIVTIDEVRASKGLPSLADGKGLMTVPEAKALAQSASNPANPTPPSQE